MDLIVLTLALAIQATAPEPIIVVGRGWAPFISPMGEPFRAQSAEDDTLVSWFRQADRDGDAALGAAEMDADALRFFATLDSDGNRQILPEEILAYEGEVAPEVQVNSRWRDPLGTPKPKNKPTRTNWYEPDGLQGAARYGLLNMPQPVVAADTNFDRAVTTDEFRRAAAQRFHLLDSNGDGNLHLPELQTLLPPPRKGYKRRKINKHTRDTRIANPVPVSR